MSDLPSRFSVSAHLFLNGMAHSVVGDVVLVDAVRPFIAACHDDSAIERWFFIRYPELGPHIRRRLQPAHGVSPETLADRLLDALRARYSDLSASSAPPLPAASLGRREPPRIRHVMWSPYLPELDRYGGPRGVDIAEDHFQASSQLALALLDGMTTADRTARLGRALAATLVVAHAFSESRNAAARFLRDYAFAYRPPAPTMQSFETLAAASDATYRDQAETLGRSVEEIWARLADRDPLTDALDEFRRQVDDTQQRLRALAATGGLVRADGLPHEPNGGVRWIAHSYLHMTNNRIGLMRDEETHLARLLDHALCHGSARVAV
jgi:thiopeptide-type bacteriocin biosynthesis protein